MESGGRGDGELEVEGWGVRGVRQQMVESRKQRTWRLVIAAFLKERKKKEGKAGRNEISVFGTKN